MFYLYILKSSKDKKLYIGYTDNLKKRFREHNQGLAKSTKNRIPFDLIYYKAYFSKKDAKFIKTCYQKLLTRLKLNT
ncbi:GIY-YIG nuclease family protein [bacterium]|nr:GIY-YIG nuclease family protein [bacterium]